MGARFNGEVYDMNKDDRGAPHQAVWNGSSGTNLTNGKTAVVRITDRGPF